MTSSSSASPSPISPLPKVRPAVVLATHGDDVTIVGVFSSIPQPVRSTWLVMSDQDPHFAATGLRKASVIKAERIAVIEQSLIVRKLGTLPTAQFQRAGSSRWLAGSPTPVPIDVGSQA